MLDLDLEFARAKPAQVATPAVALRALRRREELSREALARLSGSKAGKIADMENGKRPIPAALAVIFSKVLRTSPRMFQG